MSECFNRACSVRSENRKIVKINVITAVKVTFRPKNGFLRQKRLLKLTRLLRESD
jgi:hypothetical protein